MKRLIVSFSFSALAAGFLPAPASNLVPPGVSPGRAWAQSGYDRWRQDAERVRREVERMKRENERRRREAEESARARREAERRKREWDAEMRRWERERKREAEIERRRKDERARRDKNERARRETERKRRAARERMRENERRRREAEFARREAERRRRAEIKRQKTFYSAEEAGFRAYQRGDWDAAVRHWKEALAYDPHNPTIEHNLRRAKERKAGASATSGAPAPARAVRSQEAVKRLIEAEESLLRLIEAEEAELERREAEGVAPPETLPGLPGLYLRGVEGAVSARNQGSASDSGDPSRAGGPDKELKGLGDPGGEETRQDRLAGEGFIPPRAPLKGLDDLQRAANAAEDAAGPGNSDTDAREKIGKTLNPGPSVVDATGSDTSKGEKKALANQPKSVMPDLKGGSDLDIDVPPLEQNPREEHGGPGHIVNQVVNQAEKIGLKGAGYILKKAQEKLEKAPPLKQAPTPLQKAKEAVKSAPGHIVNQVVNQAEKIGLKGAGHIVKEVKSAPERIGRVSEKIGGMMKREPEPSLGEKLDKAVEKLKKAQENQADPQEIAEQMTEIVRLILEGMKAPPLKQAPTSLQKAKEAVKSAPGHIVNQVVNQAEKIGLKGVGHIVKEVRSAPERIGRVSEKIGGMMKRRNEQNREPELSPAEKLKKDMDKGLRDAWRKHLEEEEERERRRRRTRGSGAARSPLLEITRPPGI